MLEEIVQGTPDFMDAHVNLARIYYRKKMKAEGDREQETIERLRVEQQKRQPGSQKRAEDVENSKTGKEEQPQ